MARRCFSWFSIFSFSRLILCLSFLSSSVSEALFALSFSFLSERFFFVKLKLLLRVVEINNTVVTGQFLLPKKEFEHACGPRNSTYAVNLTYDRHTLIYHAKSRLNTPVWGSLRSPNYAQLHQCVGYSSLQWGFLIFWCCIKRINRCVDFFGGGGGGGGEEVVIQTPECRRDNTLK